jgi:hypothetical protein
LQHFDATQNHESAVQEALCFDMARKEMTISTDLIEELVDLPEHQVPDPIARQSNRSEVVCGSRLRVRRGRFHATNLKPMRLTIALLFVLALSCRADQLAVGRWEGSVRIPERELKLIVDLAQDSGGAWIGSITIPGLDVKGAALSDITVNGSEVTLAIKSALGAQRVGPAKFKGHAKDATLTGEFIQAGNTAPFTLEKNGAPQVELPPQSTPIAKEFEGEWKGEYELFGYPRHVTIKLANRATKGATAEFVIVGRKTNNLPVDLVTQEGGLLTIDSHDSGISYECRFRKDNGEIQGTMTQGPLEIPLVLRRAK